MRRRPSASFILLTSLIAACLFGATAIATAPSSVQIAAGIPSAVDGGESPFPTPAESPSGTIDPTPTPTAPTPTPSPSATPIRINFQPLDSVAVCGYTPDNGDTYGTRNDLSYGWNVNHRSGTRDRGVLSDQLLDTLAHFGTGGKWEIEVPNGQHEVKVGIGDTAHSSNHAINVEGVNFWNNVFLSRYQFVQLTKTVTVSDGRITIDQGSLTDGKTHINYVEIDTAGTTACPPASPSPSPSPTATPTASISATPSPSVTPSLSPKPSASPTPSPTPTPVGGPEIKVNFQSAGSPTVCGYASDYGATYGSRSTDLAYGWNFSHSDVMRDRNLNPDQLLDTLGHIHSGGAWEVAVGNGLHKVTVGIGDAGYRSTHYLFVEGVAFWNGIRLGANEFVQTTKQVLVADGRLTITQGGAIDKATRIDYIEIDPDGVKDVCPLPTPTPTPTPSKSPSASPAPSGSPSTGPSPTPTPDPDPLPLRKRQVRINFQSRGSPKVCGWDPDRGVIYDERNDAIYGWNFDHSDVMRDRGLKNDQRIDTLAHFHTGGIWEVKLRKGRHRVTVGIGDAGFASRYTLNVEGENLWRNVALGADEFRQTTRVVEVRDGRLTLDQGGAPDNATRINFLAVNVDGPPAGCDGGDPEVKPTPKPRPNRKPRNATIGGGGSVGARPYGLSGLIRVFGSRCNKRANDARTWFPSAGGVGREGYVYYHSKLARKVGGRILGSLNHKHMRGAVNYGVWGYACRIKVGGTSWSVHSWGAAIDTNTAKNPWQATRWNGVGANGRDYGRRYPRLWLNQGFYWGIHFRDPMHFQYVAGY